MKRISGGIAVFIFFISVVTQAQTPSISGVLDFDISKLTFKKKRISPLDVNFNFRFNKLPAIDGIHTFSVFNRTTGLNDTYIITKNSFEYSTSSLLLENNTRGFNTKVDSFNPNGANDFGGAVVNGLLNLIFD